MIERVVKTISRYSMFETGQTVGVAVSGGADSVCLLYVLREIAERLNLRLKVVHLNHLIRGEEADADEAFVREMAETLGLAAHIERADVRRRRDNLEQAARRARQVLFLKLLRTGEADSIATGHTRSDQAETVLFRFLRGAGPTGLSAIRPLTKDGIARPLLEIDRAETEEYLRSRGVRWRTDSTNADPAFARNRIRHALLPALTREWNPKLPETLARMAQIVVDEEQFWESETARYAKPVLSAAELTALAPALRRRVIRRSIELAKGDLRGIGFAHIEDVAALAELRTGHARLQIPGLDVVRSFDAIRLAPPARPEPDVSKPVEVPGAYDLWGFTIRLEVLANPPNSMQMNESSSSALATTIRSGYNGEYRTTHGYVLDWERISGGTLVLRNWRSGDRYLPIGHATEIKLKHLFQQARIPVWQRRAWPILARGEEILWVSRFGPGSRFAATAASRKLLNILEITSE